MPLALAEAAKAVDQTLYVVGTGIVTFKEARDFQIALLGDKRLYPGCRMLCDVRTMDGAPSASELKILAREMAPLLNAGLGPVAIVCASPFIYGVARMFATLAEVVHADVAAFRDIGEARDWLEGHPATT
jgi:hypothetical protein